MSPKGAKREHKKRNIWNQFSKNSISPIFVSTYVPTPCGLATFTQDLADAVDGAAGKPVSRVAAITGDGDENFDRRVDFVIDREDKDSYAKAARFCNQHPCELVSIQHEFGLYAGEWGSSILDFAKECRKPIVATLHTVLPEPEEKARMVINRLASLSEKLVVMADIGVELLKNVYEVPGEKVTMIPHGVHPMPKCDIHEVRENFHLTGDPVIMTFGLINPGKGIEYAIKALPQIVSEYPNAQYVIAGRTHPVVRKQNGEQYRESLIELAEKLGVRENVKFVNKYLSRDELLRYIAACDIYLTPYLGRDQIVSGTLAYAVAAGKAVVSTPYLHAEELAEKGALLNAEFRDSDSIAENVLNALNDTHLRRKLESRALEIGREMLWSNVGRRYQNLFSSLTARASSPVRRLEVFNLKSAPPRPGRFIGSVHTQT